MEGSGELGNGRPGCAGLSALEDAAVWNQSTIILERTAEFMYSNFTDETKRSSNPAGRRWQYFGVVALICVSECDLEGIEQQRPRALGKENCDMMSNACEYTKCGYETENIGIAEGTQNRD